MKITLKQSACPYQRSVTFQWAQLFALAVIHFCADLFGGILPVILPVVRLRFGLTLTWGVVIIAVLNLSANGGQLLVGHMRSSKSKPLLLPIGLVLATALCLLANVPISTAAVGLIFVLMIVGGGGISIVHPEGLRAVHSLKGIPAAIATSIFMSAGFMGFTSGGLIAAALVTRFGLRGLYWFFLCPVISILLMVFLRIRLAVETKPGDTTSVVMERKHLPFWPIVIMTIPAVTSTFILISLLPTRLNELGFAITFGGISTTVLGMASILGSFFWAALAHRKGELFCSIVALFAGIPFLVVYLAVMDNKTSVWLLFVTGLCSTSSYPLMVTMARYASGLNLGQRMAFIVGGTCGTASLVLMVLGPVAEHFGVQVVLNLTPIGYLLSAIAGVLIMYISQKQQITFQHQKL